VHITTKQGLDIPIIGAPEGKLQKVTEHSVLALDLSPFRRTQFKLLVKEGDEVLIGQPLAFDKKCPERLFVSPASGKVKAINRGLKRRLLNIVVECTGEKRHFEHPRITLQSSTRESLVKYLLGAGVFPHIRQRPCDVLADPAKAPRAIFVNAIRSTPFSPSSYLVVRGHETEFQLGLNVLQRLTDGAVHLVYPQGSNLHAFTHADGVSRHTAKGPHPIGSPSVHIEKISPIMLSDEVVWTIDAEDVLRIGRLLQRGVYDPRRVVGVGGECVPPEKRVFWETKMGCSFQDITGIAESPSVTRLITGNVLTGEKAEAGDYLSFYDNCFTLIPEKGEGREMFHFFRLGLKKYSASKAYASGFTSLKKFGFTTNQHGEERAFVDGTIYDKVMPLGISTMHLVKAILAEDYDAAQELGLLEVSSEDFALPTFVCPSKIEMVEIMRDGLDNYYEQYLM